MKLFLLAQALEVWQIVEDGYTIPSDLSTLGTVEKRRYDCNSRAASLIMGAIVDSKLVEIVHLSIAKEMWDKIQNVFLGDENVKTVRLQSYKSQFEFLKMEDDEDVASFFHRIDEIINTMRGLGQKMEEKDVILKILRSLPMRFYVKVLALEERIIRKYFDINELQGVLTTNEM